MTLFTQGVSMEAAIAVLAPVVTPGQISAAMYAAVSAADQAKLDTVAAAAGIPLEATAAGPAAPPSTNSR